MRAQRVRRLLVVASLAATVVPVGLSSASAASGKGAAVAHSTGSPSARTHALPRADSIKQKTVVRHNKYAGKAPVPQLARSSATATTDTGTPICDQIGAPNTTTTWTAAGAPYLICASGVTVDGSLVLDGSDGGFEVQAQGINGLTVASQSSTLTTANTSADSRITFDSAGGITWAGLSASSNQASPVFDLEHVTIDDASTAVVVTPASGGVPPAAVFDDVTVNGSAREAFLFRTANATITDSTINGTGANGTPADGISAICDPIRAGTQQVTVTGTTVADAPLVGIDVENCSDPQITSDSVVDSGTALPLSPAISVTSGLNPESELVDPATTFELGAATGIGNDKGAGNGIDAVAVAGLQQGGFTWVTPTDSATDHPLGYLNLGLAVQGTGTVTVPASAVVKSEALPEVGNGPNYDLIAGEFKLDDASLTVGKGATFTSLSDDSVGLPTCETALENSCAPSPSDWVGLLPNAGATLTDDTIEHATDCLSGFDGFPGVPGDPEPVITATGITVTDCIAGIQAASLSLTGSTVSEIQQAATPYFLDQAIYAVGSVTLTDDTVSDCPSYGEGVGGLSSGGVWISPGDGGPSDTANVSDLTMTDCGSFQVTDGPFDVPFATPQIRDVTITGSPLEAATIDAGAVSIGPGGDIDDISGGGNGQDWIDFDVDVVGDLDWVTPTNSTDVHPLGYFGTFDMLGGTLTVPAGGVVEPADITLTGGSLVAPAGSATTALTQFGASINMGAGVPNKAGSLTLLDGPLGQAPSVDLDGVNWSNLDTISDQADSPGASITIANSSLSALSDSAFSAGPPNLGVANGTLNVSGNSWFANIGLSATGPGSYSVVDANIQPGYSGSALTATDGATVEVDDTQVQEGPTDLQAFDGGVISGQCDALIGANQAIVTDASSQVTMTDSDLEMNNYYGSWDPRIQANGGEINVQRDWWGSGTPPISSGVDSSGSVDEAYPRSVITLGGTALQSDGTVGPRTLTVTMAFNRRMDVTTDPEISLRTSSGSRLPLTGSWMDATHYVASRAITAAESGKATITAYGEVGCANDPNRNFAHERTMSFYLGVPQRPVIRTQPATWTPQPRAAAFSFSSVGAKDGYVCRLDGVSRSCQSPYYLSGLRSGTHHLQIAGRNGAGLGPADSFTWVVDPIGPQVVVEYSPPQLLLKSRVRYGIVPVEAGKKARHDLQIRLRIAAPGQALGKPEIPKAWSDFNLEGHVTIDTKPGYTYCFSGRAGVQARWSNETCTTRALDDRVLTDAESGWNKPTGSAYFDRTLTTSPGAYPNGELQTTVVADRFSVRSWSCSTCGVLDIYLNGATLGEFNLQRSGPPRPITDTFRTSKVERGTLAFYPDGNAPVDIDAFATADLATGLVGR